MSTNYTPDQKRAVEFFPTNTVKKHLVIEAGAGSGKTTILKERIKFLLTEKNYLPEDLVVITFTNNSTSELKHRISQLEGKNNLSEDVKFIHVSTIDSFFASLVESLYPIWWDNHSQFAAKIPSQLTLLSEKIARLDLEKQFTNQMEKFSDIEMREVADFILSGGFEKKENFLATRSPFQTLLSTMLSDVFLSAHLNDIRISAQTIHPATQKIITKCHHIARMAYEKRIAAGTFTYQDRNIFLKENIHISCPLFFKELIVDEYQDTNHIQHSILWKLVELNQAQMTVVGDPKQSIYAFRGSHVDVFQSLIGHEQWNVISLDVNFRSTQKLLAEVNTLSKLSFDWQTVDLPNQFLNSFFYKEAIKKYIGHKELKVGITTGSVSDQCAITLFEYAAPPSVRGLSAGGTTKREFNENNIRAFGYYLKEQVNLNEFQWKDMAILCEKNTQVAKIKKLFFELDIPFLAEKQDAYSNINNFVNMVGLSLFNVLCDGIKAQRIDLFNILISPLTEFAFDEVIDHFLYGKMTSKINDVIQILMKYHAKFTHQTFIAWQTCRFDLAYYCAHATQKMDSLFFCTQLDEFAEKLLSLSQMESIDSFDKILATTTFDSKKTARSNSEENAIAIKTVHGAKGLEWDVVCFYPATSKSHVPESFSVSNSWPNLDINWLSEDKKSLSYLQKMPNEKFNEIDYYFDDKKEKYIWFSDLRNNLEKNFERQRIFYTAFTRPRKKLIFLHPERHGANAARQIDKKFSFSGYEKNFEQDVFLKYAYLTQEGKTSGEHIRFSLETSFRDLPSRSDHLPSTFHEHVEYPQPNEVCNESLDVDIISKSQNTRKQILQEQIISTPSSIIQQKQKKRRAAHKGILFHTKAENKIFSQSSIQHLIHSKAIQTWTEFEVWSRTCADNFHSERKIIDLLAVFHKPIFSEILPALTHSCQYFDWNTTNESSNFVFFIVDFKTGILTASAVKQIENYALLIEKLCLADWFKSVIQTEHKHINIASALIREN